MARRLVSARLVSPRLAREEDWGMTVALRRALAVLCLTALLVLALGMGTRWYRASRPDERLRVGQEALERGDGDLASRLVQDLERAGHKDHARLLHADILYREHRYLQALKTLDQIRDEGALRLQAATLGGWCYLQARNLSEAARHFHFVLDHWPEQLSAQRGLSKVYYHQGAMGQARRHLEEVVRLDPEDGPSLQFLGHIYKDQDTDRPRAVSCYRAALRCGPKGADNE